MNQQLATVITMTLNEVSNQALATSNLALMMSNKIPTYNLGYQELLDLNLIKATGEPFGLEELQAALSFTINNRVENGEWE